MLGDSVRRRSAGQRAPQSRRQEPRPDGAPRLRWKRWVPLLLAAAVVPFLIGYAIAVWLIFPPPPVTAAGIPVPELRGMTQAEARSAVTSAGLGGVEPVSLPHPDEPPGTVIAQAPLPGQQLRAGAPVRIAVSSGVPTMTVPDVNGFPAERARRMLERLGFEVLEEEREDTVQRGRIVMSEPAAGERVPLPATVRLIVSAGPPQLLDSLGFPIDTTGAAIDTFAPLPDTTGTSGGGTR